MQGIKIVVKAVALDGFSRGLAEIHGSVPLFLHFVGPRTPLHPSKAVQLIISFGGRQVQEQRADGVGLVIEKKVELRLRKSLDVLPTTCSLVNASMDVNVPISGVNPGCGPTIHALSAAFAATGSAASEASPTATPTPPFRKLRRLGIHSAGSIRNPPSNM